MDTPAETIDVEIAGKTRHLRLTTINMDRIERELHEDPLAMLNNVCAITKVGDGPLDFTYRVGSLSAMVTLLWAACLPEDPKLTRKEAAEMIDRYRQVTGDSGLSDLALVLRSAWNIGAVTRTDDSKNVEAEARAIQ